MTKSLKKLMRLNHRGDSIVEVLISIAIISLVVASAFALTNRNTSSMQASKEHVQGQKMVERQIELLRQEADKNAVVGGCFDSSGDKKTGADCVVMADGQKTPDNYSGASYTLSITKTSNPSSPNIFVVSAKWERLGGGTGEVTMYYVP